jgi:type IV pilus assembly protein PilV
MLRKRQVARKAQRGTSLIEVLITVLIVAFGLLGVAALQSKMAVSEVESYQRAQAVLLLAEMADRLSANRAQAVSYVTGGTVGTGDAQPADCTGIAQGPNRDVCEWSNALKGAAEQKAGTGVGAMLGARGCITQVQAQNTTLGACTAGVYQVSVVWQGIAPTHAPPLACGQGLYGADASRRLVSTNVVLATQMPDGTVSCYTP